MTDTAQLDVGEHLPAEKLRRGDHGITVDRQRGGVGNQRRLPAHRGRAEVKAEAPRPQQPRGPLCEHLEQRPRSPAMGMR